MAEENALAALRRARTLHIERAGDRDAADAFEKGRLAAAPGLYEKVLDTTLLLQNEPNG